MPNISPCAVFLIVVFTVIFVTYISLRSFGRGFGLAYEGCLTGAFDADAQSANETNTYRTSEGLASSKFPAYVKTEAMKQAKRQEGFIYRETSGASPNDRASQNYKKTEKFSYDFPYNLGPNKATQQADLVASPFIGYL